MASPTQWTWDLETPGDREEQGGLVYYVQSMGSQRVRLKNWTTTRKYLNKYNKISEWAWRKVIIFAHFNMIFHNVYYKLRCFNIYKLFYIPSLRTWSLTSLHSYYELGLLSHLQRAEHGKWKYWNFIMKQFDTTTTAK